MTLKYRQEIVFLNNLCDAGFVIKLSQCTGDLPVEIFRAREFLHKKTPEFFRMIFWQIVVLPSIVRERLFP